MINVKLQEKAAASGGDRREGRQASRLAGQERQREPETVLFASAPINEAMLRFILAPGGNGSLRRRCGGRCRHAGLSEASSRPSVAPWC